MSSWVKADVSVAPSFRLFRPASPSTSCGARWRVILAMNAPHARSKALRIVAGQTLRYTRGGRCPPAALCRAPTGIRHRHRLLAPRAFAAPAAARRFDKGGASSSSMMPRRRSSTAATSSSMRSTMPSRASPCLIATCGSWPGTRLSSTCTNCRPDLVRVGVGMDSIIHFNASRGSYGEGIVEELVRARIHSFLNDLDPGRLKLHPSRQSDRDSARTGCRMAASSRLIPT